MVRHEYHLEITADETARAHELLAVASGLSRVEIKLAMQKGAVWLTRNGNTRRLRRHKHTLSAGDTLHLYHAAEILEQLAPEPRLLADEGDYSVWHKPLGMLSQGSKWGDHTTLPRWAEQHLLPQRPAFLVHRLDRAARGLMLLAHSRSFARLLAGMFENRRVEKRYRVIVAGEFPARPLVITLDTEIDGRKALSFAQRLGYDPLQNRSLLEVRIETGRKHQIRRHLAEAGFPVIGDRLHGKPEQHEDLQLAAVRLIFEHPLSGDPKHYQLSDDGLSWPNATSKT